VLLVIIGIILLLFNYYLEQQIEKKLDAFRQTGYPVNCKELSEWYRLPEGAENAADILVEALSQFIQWEEKPVPKEIFLELNMGSYDETDSIDNGVPDDWDLA